MFDKRAKMRTAEMDGLTEAKEFLSGAGTGEATLLQKKHTASSTDDVFSAIEFRGLR